MTIFVVPLQHRFAATSRSRRRTRFIPAPHPFHPSACKRRQGITDQFSISSSSTPSSGPSAIVSGFQLSAIFGKPSPPKPLPRQIPIDGQALTAFPRVRSSEAFRRRPLYWVNRSRRAGIPKPFTLWALHRDCRAVTEIPAS
jgi:hypothetical protein